MKEINAIIDASDCLLNENLSEAKRTIESNLPHRVIKYHKRQMTIAEKLSIFIRDGFIDRFTGEKLVFPNVLRILSFHLQEALD